MNKPDRALMMKAIQEAQDAGVAAAKAHLEKIGGDNYPCGFAWVTIRPARGPWVNLLKELSIGKTDSYAGGYMIWGSQWSHCQNMDAKEVAAWAFAEVLRKYGVNCSVGSRLD